MCTLFTDFFHFVLVLSVRDGTNTPWWFSCRAQADTCVDELQTGAVSGTDGLFGLFIGLAVVYM